MDARGRVKMVDVGAKPATAREAVARGSITMRAAALKLIRSGNVAKGDPLQAAKLLDVVADAANTELAEVREVLANLRGVEMELLGQALR